MIGIDMEMPDKCDGCIFCDDNCSCVASDYNGLGINVGNAYRTERKDIRCPLKDIVRCKDCKYHFVDGDNVRFNVCMLNHNKVQTDDWFCADGERKEVK